MLQIGVRGGGHMVATIGGAILSATKGNLETVSFLKTVEIQCDTETQTLPMSVSLDNLSVSVDNLSAPTTE